MAKRFSRINFILVSILVAIGIFLSVCSFDIPFGVTDDYAGFANAITLNYDVGEGRTAVYEVTPASTEITTVTDEKMQESVLFVKEVLDMFGANYNQVGVQNKNMIRVDVEEVATTEGLMNAFSNRVELIIRGEDTAERTEYDISAARIKRCAATYQQTSATSSTYSYGVFIEFDDLGTRQYKELTEYVSNNGKTVYFYNTDGEKVGSLSDITKQVSVGQTFLADSNLTSENATREFAINIMTGAIDVNFDIKENSVSSAYLGFNSVLYIVISLLVAFVAINIFMIVRYKDLGLMSMLTSFINICLYLFFLQALPNTFFSLSLSGIFGCVVGFALTIISHVIIFEKIKREYAKGKKIPLSFKLGFKGATLNIVDICVVSILGSIVLYFIGAEIIKSFAVSLFVGALLAMFSSLIVTKTFTKWYLPLNSTKPNRLALKKETVNEEE